ncbi:MAG: hypothetical protein NC548_30355 [Lachnospiraceae bacterium]|nr:hypothetical protein [Lachnospiraceae bacterium]
MDNKQLAHDLAVAKLYGSDLTAEKLVEQYHKYYDEIYGYLKSQVKSQKVQVIQNPFG